MSQSFHFFERLATLAPGGAALLLLFPVPTGCIFFDSCHAKYFLKSCIDMLSVVFLVEDAFPGDAPLRALCAGDFLAFPMLFFPGD